MRSNTFLLHQEVDEAIVFEADLAQMKAQLKDERFKKRRPTAEKGPLFFLLFSFKCKKLSGHSSYKFYVWFCLCPSICKKKMVLHDMLSVIRVEQDSIEKHLLCVSELTPTNKSILLNHH